MLQIIIRTFIIYLFIFGAVKIMGKHELAELHPFDLVVLLIISDMASVSMQDSGLPLTSSLVPIITLTVLDVGISLISLNNPRFRRFFGGVPSILIERGIINQRELRRQRMSIDDLAQELRSLGYFSVSEVEYAIMESNGQVNAIPKSPSKPATLRDLQIKREQEQPAMILIADGIIDEAALKKAGKNRAWLQKELKRNNIDKAKDVFLAELAAGQFEYTLKDKQAQND